MHINVKAAKEKLAAAQVEFDKALNKEARLLQEVLHNFTTKKPPLGYCEAWLKNNDDDIEKEALQQWTATNAKPAFSYFYGIGLIEAAIHLLDNQDNKERAQLCHKIGLELNEDEHDAL